MNWNKIIITSIESLPEIIKSLSWPVAVVIIIFIFRKPIGDLIKRIEEAETKWAKIKFKKGLEEVKSIAKETEKKPEREAEIIEKDIYSPISEIISSWNDVENTCQKLLAAKGQHIPLTFRALGSRLKRHNLIDNEHAMILDKLRQLRNVAVHGGSEAIDSDDASEFIRLSENIIEYLREQIDSSNPTPPGR